MDGADLLEQRLIGSCPHTAGTLRTLAPSVVAAAGHLERAAQAGDVELGGVRLDEPVPHRASLAK
jgi:hypothetical protein